MFDRIVEDLETIVERDPAAHSKLEVVLCYPGFHALAIHRVAYWCNLQGWTTFSRWLSHVSRFLTGIEIHPAARIGRRVFIDHGMGVVIGETAEVGDDCTIYHGVTLGGVSLGRGEKRHPTLGKGVIVGSGAKILGGFSVGDNAIIGSNAVVVKPVEASQTLVGVPARTVEEQKTINTSQTFAAYGVVDGEEDPYIAMISAMQKQLATQQATIETLKGEIDALRAQNAPQAEDVPQVEEKLIQVETIKPEVAVTPEVSEKIQTEEKAIETEEPLIQVETVVEQVQAPEAEQTVEPPVLTEVPVTETVAENTDKKAV